ncbi:aldolase/citrate lyase family protein [Fulvivirgaceae bacterium BMA12]|uniref:Aldolase/citrate lyase family protein n=1 Tax=Agaribacillus aureus TaxID=3051825 RepID=A0ABT8LHQ0_9BACT|nr:aldolase/citrate lyase family protein [Fulvivirgaceae bacterium BMA12]
MNSKQLLEKIKSGGRIYGTAIVSSATMWPGAVKEAGLDFVFLDTEHVALNRESLANMCQVYAALGLPPVVRIPSPDPYIATTVLDGGAAAILAPYVESVEQVKQLVGATKYRPLKGKKLQQILDNPGGIDKNLKDYIDHRCRNNLLFVNIESEPAVENLSELISVPGVDGVIIGPHDLSCSLSLPEAYTHPAFEKVVTEIINACRERNLGIGIHLSEEPEQQIKWANKGVNIIMHSSDISLFGKLLRHDLAEIRASLNDVKVYNRDDSVII